MYIPPPFSVTDRETICDFIEAFPFATLVSNAEQVPNVSHLPLFLDEDAVSDNLRLLGHFARENPHRREIDGDKGLAIFHGPHAYISPAWYASPNVVPTWNYVAVHVRGTFQLIDDRTELLALLRRTVHQFESAQEAPWSLDSPDSDFVEGMMSGIVGFQFHVEEIEAKWKLSQNHPAERREKVVRALEVQGDYQAMAVATAMRKLRDE
jgi:transcriptional regulator